MRAPDAVRTESLLGGYNDRFPSLSEAALMATPGSDAAAGSNGTAAFPTGPNPLSSSSLADTYSGNSGALLASDEDLLARMDPETLDMLRTAGVTEWEIVQQARANEV